jgi:hypothetical protein
MRKRKMQTLKETLSDSSFERDTQDDKSRSVEEIPRPRIGERGQEVNPNNHRVIVSL